MKCIHEAHTEPAENLPVRKNSNKVFVTHTMVAELWMQVGIQDRVVTSSVVSTVLGGFCVILCSSLVSEAYILPQTSFYRDLSLI